MVKDLGEEWHCRRVCYKPYPVGHLIIGPIEIILDILRTQPIDWHDVESIEITTYDHAIFRTGKYSSPDSTYIDAHCSIPFCVAVSLMDGQLTPTQLWKERLRDPQVYELASRVVLIEDPAMSAAYPKQWPVQRGSTPRFGTGSPSPCRRSPSSAVLAKGFCCKVGR